MMNMVGNPQSDGLQLPIPILYLLLLADCKLLCQHVAFHKLKDAGAVASSAAAKIYNLNILAEDIQVSSVFEQFLDWVTLHICVGLDTGLDYLQDDSDNVTRFLMLAREPIIPGTDRPFKVSCLGMY